MNAFVSYQDENGNKVEGMFELLEQKDTFIKIKTSRNIIIIPYHKVNKIKIDNQIVQKGGADKI